MKLLHVLSSIIMMFVLIGCPDENAPQPTPKQSEIVPLALGNKWTYKKEYSYKDEKGNTISKEETYIISHDSVRNIDGKQVFTETGSVIGGTTQTWAYVYNDDMGYWNSDRTLAHTQLLAKHPGNVGDKWGEGTGITTDGEGNTIEEYYYYYYIVSTNTAVKANNKNYNCYQYRLQFCDLKTKEPILNSYTDTYYAENIGFVMMKQVHEGKEVLQIELMDYMVK